MKEQSVAAAIIVILLLISFALSVALYQSRNQCIEAVELGERAVVVAERLIIINSKLAERANRDSQDLPAARQRGTTESRHEAEH